VGFAKDQHTFQKQFPLLHSVSFFEGTKGNVNIQTAVAISCQKLMN